MKKRLSRYKQRLPPLKRYSQSIEVKIPSLDKQRQEQSTRLSLQSSYIHLPPQKKRTFPKVELGPKPKQFGTRKKISSWLGGSNSFDFYNKLKRGSQSLKARDLCGYLVQKKVLAQQQAQNLFSDSKGTIDFKQFLRKSRVPDYQFQDNNFYSRHPTASRYLFWKPQKIGFLDYLSKNKFTVKQVLDQCYSDQTDQTDKLNSSINHIRLQQQKQCTYESQRINKIKRVRDQDQRRRDSLIHKQKFIDQARIRTLSQSYKKHRMSQIVF